MKKNKWIIVIIAFALLLTQIVYVKADSGWDSSYDSGGSSWSSSDSGWSSSSDSFGEGNPGVIGLVIIIFIIFWIASFVKEPNNDTPLASSSDISDEDLKKYGINREQFEKMVYDKYVEIQEAWSNFDYDKLRTLLTDELYNSYVMQLDALQLKKEQNIMSNYELVSAKIIGLKEENGLLNVETYLNVRMYDYVVDKNKKVVRGDDKHRIDISYTVTFVKTASQETKITKCPNCGAEIDAVVGGTCSYCRTVIVDDAKDFVMSKKTCIGQRKL